MPIKERSSLLDETKPVYADVVVPRHIAQAFTYLVPPKLLHALRVGQRVLVPFGRGSVEAVVISLSDQQPPGLPISHLKAVTALISDPGEAELFSSLFALSRKISEQYVAPWGQCLRLIFPPTPGKTASRYIVTEQGQAALSSGQCPEDLRFLLKRIARRSTGVASSTIQQSGSRSGTGDIEILKSHGWISETAANPKQTRVPQRGAKASAVAQIRRLRELPPADPAVLNRISSGVGASKMNKIVIQAPWEQRVSLLVASVQKARAMAKSVIVVSGEVARAAWLAEQIVTRTNLPITFFPAGRQGPSVSDDAEQGSEETPMIVVGTRSALFAPLKSIGLIWVDQEDDPALKELQEPRYHARDVACMRADIERALVVLGSSHPSLESLTDAFAEVCTVHEHPDRRRQVELIDLRSEPAGTLFDQKLVAAIREAVAQKAGVLLFLNRRGYAGALVCRDCGWIPRCPSCAVALTYYREAAKLACRYCGRDEELPDLCSSCRASRLSPVGGGTERAEMEARRLFPNAKIARLDGDTLRRPAAARALWEGVMAGGFDIVIGTQALFQREPLPPMGLVGILHADSGLHVPDFRAAERTYQLLVDAAGMARPQSAGGRVIVQTLLSSHHAVEAVVLSEPRRFYEEELAARRLLGYPPFCHLVSLSVSGKYVRLVETAAKQWRLRLEQSAGGPESVIVLGPVPAMAGRPRGHHRYHILAKGLHRGVLLRAVRESVETMEREYKRGRLKFVVDVDPVDVT